MPSNHIIMITNEDTVQQRDRAGMCSSLSSQMICDESESLLSATPNVFKQSIIRSFQTNTPPPPTSRKSFGFGCYVIFTDLQCINLWVMLYVALWNSDMQYANCPSVLAIWSITSQPLRPFTPTTASFFLCVSILYVRPCKVFIFPSFSKTELPSAYRINPLHMHIHSSSQHFTFSVIFEGIGDFSLRANLIFQRITRGQSDTDPCSETFCSWTHHKVQSHLDDDNEFMGILYLGGNMLLQTKLAKL